ncbi:MAG: hypothetical protein R2755_15920 [Acidimicrobiales bacterium]
MAPTDSLLKPVGAYQAICNCSNTACACGSMCCDGYTEFCCTLIGMNRCPPGHILGGWWKVDNSQFCNNAPRYYMDCNAPCNGCGCGANGICSGSCSGTTCGCARGWCGFRKSGCVNFRYGQCNQATQCIGPILCRVVTCVPPWTIDESCTRTIAVDEFTRFHDAACLTRPYGNLDLVAPTRNGILLRGWAFDPNTADPVTLHIYVDGQVALWVVADLNRPDVADAVPGAGPRHGFEVEIPVAEGNHTVTVYAINLLEGTENPVIGAAPVAVGTPFGTFDAQAGPGVIRAIGWVIDPDMPGGTTTVHAYIDGQFVGAYETNVFRNDVADAYRNFGGQHGFDLQFPVANGSHRIQLWAINDGGDDQPLLLGDRTISVGGDAIGYIDAPPHAQRPATGGLGARSRQHRTARHPRLCRRHVRGLPHGRRRPARCGGGGAQLRPPPRLRLRGPRRAGHQAGHRVRHRPRRRCALHQARHPDGGRRRPALRSHRRRPRRSQRGAGAGLGHRSRHRRGGGHPPLRRRGLRRRRPHRGQPPRRGRRVPRLPG